jgi:hypothetical protein
MNAATKPETAAVGLALLREPVPAHLVSKLPKGTKAQNQCPDSEKKYCNVCGTRHHPGIRHLDYVGHAAATHRLLDADPHWSWEPVAFDKDTGLPKFDPSGGLWIKLTVCGVTRLGYGHADGKATADAGAREKEVIGDAIRNAAMRFGLALDLWSKEDLHADHPEGDGDQPDPTKKPKEPAPYYSDAEFAANEKTWGKLIADGRKTVDELQTFLESKGTKRLTSHQMAALTKYTPKA